jgi:branched-chain amino acid transport system ATP-binding protein
VVTVEGVTVAFGGLVAVKDVSVEIREGELFGLIGPNGAGKTSFLNAISGVVRCASGRIEFEGRDITKMSLRKRISIGIARSFQGVELFPTLSVVENLLLGRHHLMRGSVITGGVFYGPARREEMRHREKVEEVIDFLELYPYRKLLVGSLPFGIQKLVGLGRAICAEPRLMLLDEVASGLTREEREDLARFLLRIHQERKLTMIWVEHDVRLVADLADRVMAFHYGEKIGEGTPSEVLALGEVRRSYLGEQEEIEQAIEQAAAPAVGQGVR